MFEFVFYDNKTPQDFKGEHNNYIIIVSFQSGSFYVLIYIYKCLSNYELSVKLCSEYLNF